jgi:6-methylsalicylic acid synthase
VEAHGTGTRVGDPIEAAAMTAVFGVSRRPDQPLLIGSVKPNIGHLEAGAGIAGIIKTVLALRHGEIPPNRNFTKPNPDIPWEGSGLRVVTEPTPWTRNGTPRRAGVSGYGYGGTIAHVVLQEGEVVASMKDQRAGHMYPLSSASEQGVRAYAGRLADWLAEDTAPLGSVGHTLGSRRSHLSYRACVTADSRDELVARLRQLEAGEAAPGVTAEAVLPGAGNGVVWVFSGHGSQWPGMGGELLITSPAFAAVIDEIDPVFRAEMGFSARQAILERRLGGVH